MQASRGTYANVLLDDVFLFFQEKTFALTFGELNKEDARDTRPSSRRATWVQYVYTIYIHTIYCLYIISYETDNDYWWLVTHASRNVICGVQSVDQQSH